MTTNALTLRPARPEDAGLVLQFIREIAAYEKLSGEVVATEADIRAALTGEPARVEVLLADWEERPAAFALFYHNFSTFTGRRGLYLEDLFVKPEFRGKGIGKRLLLELVQLAHQRKCARMEWVALDWNQPAIDFYEQLGARKMSEWLLFRLSADQIETLASQGDSRHDGNHTA
jgi:GNAT superfamily N-acetyltransferase